MRILVIVVALLALARASRAANEHYVDIVFKKNDADESGKLNCAEFTDLITNKLVMVCIDGKKYPKCVADIPARCSAADYNNDGGVTKKEMLDYLDALSESGDANEKALGKLFQQRLTNVNTDFKDVTDGIGKVAPAVEKASVVVEVVVTTSLNPDELFAGEREQLKKTFATLLGVDVENVYVTIMSGSAVITARAYYPDDAAASAGRKKARASLGSKDAAQQALKVPVADTPQLSTQFPYGFHPINYTIPAIMGGVTLVLILLAVAIASFAAKRRLAYKGEASKFPSCCNTGCCSAYAVKGWSFNVGVGSFIFAIVGAVLLYLALNSAADAMKGLAMDMYVLRDLGGDATAFLDEIEPYLDFWKPFVRYLSMLDLGAILPGALTCLWLVLASLCACRNSTSLCCAKFFVFVSNVFLIVCFVFYAIFASLANAVKVPLIQKKLKIVYTICYATLPNARQQLADAQNALKAASSSSLSDDKYTKLAATMNYNQNLTTALTSTCGHVDTIFDEMVPRVFIPGCVCLLAVVFAFYTINGLCCAAKCCKTPDVTKNNDLGISTNVKYEIETATKHNEAV